MWSLVLVGLLGLADASFQVEKRATYPVSPFIVQAVTGELAEIVDREWKDVASLQERLEIDFAICDTRVVNQQHICEECTERECSEDEMNTVGLICTVSTKLVKNLAKGIKDIGKNIGRELKNFGGNVKDKIKSIGKDIGKGLKKIGKGIEKGVKKAGEAAVDTVKGIGKGVGKVAGKIHDTIKGIGKSIGKAVSKVFRAPRIRLPRIRLPRIRVRRFRVRFRSRRWGKKKRSVDAITDSYDSVSDLQLRDTVEECMARCSTCEPFPGQPNEIVDSICGKKLLEQNETISRTVRKLEKLADHVIQEENNQLVVSIEYDPITYDPNQGGFTGVFVNAYFESGFRTYQSKIPYKLSANSDTAALLAAEYWKEFMKP